MITTNESSSLISKREISPDLLPPFGHRDPMKVTPEDVETFVATKLASGSAQKSVLNYLGVLHSVFDLAVRQGWAAVNPCEKLEAKPRTEPSADIHFLDQDEIEALLQTEQDDELGRVLRVMYLTAAMTGLRQGELLALRWSDVDWSSSRVRVRRAFVRGEYGTPKSKRSSRSVPLADRVAGELDRLFQRSDFQGDDDLVFAHPRLGHPIDRSKVRKRYIKARDQAGIRKVSFHDLRHTFATQMAAAGVPIRTLQEWLGHRDIKTTLIYADYAPNEHEALWVNRAFSSTGPPKGFPAHSTARLSPEIHRRR